MRQRQIHRLASTRGSIELHQLAQHDRDRPSVEQDVVKAQHEAVTQRVETDQAGAQQIAGSEVKPLRPIIREQFLQPALGIAALEPRPIDRAPWRPRITAHHLHQPAKSATSLRNSCLLQWP
jgi:hypothetical protein